MSNEGEYWASPAGIDQRLNDLAESFVYETYNGAVQMYGENNNVYGAEVIEDLSMSPSSVTCKICLPFVGRIYRFGQFMPHFPKHPHCKHFLRLVFRSEFNP